MKKRILHIIPTDNIAGVEMYVYNLIKGLQLDYDFYVLVGGYNLLNKFREILPSSRLFVMNFNWNMLRKLLFLKKIAVRNNIEIIHSHLGKARVLAALGHLFIKAKTIYTEHTRSANTSETKNFPVLRNFLHMLISNFIDKKVICLCTKSVYYLSSTGVKKSKVILLYPGINLQKTLEEKTRKRENIRFLYVGRFEKIKGVDLLVRAIKLLKEDNRKIYEKSIFYFVGYGKLEEYINTKIKKEKLYKVKNLSLLPNSQVKKVMAKCDWLILPSRSEVSPIVILEALSNNLPIIATKTGIADEILSDKNSIFVESNSQSIAEGITKGCFTQLNVNLNRKFCFDNFKLEMSKIYNAL